MKRDKVTINGEVYEVGFSFLAIREYEQMTGESISQCTSTWDNLLFFYATLKAINKHFTLSLDDFVAEMDNHPELLADFQTANAPEPESENLSQPAKKKHSLKETFGLWTLSLLLAVSPISIPIIFTIIFLWQSLKLSGKLIAKIGKKPGFPS